MLGCSRTLVLVVSVLSAACGRPAGVALPTAENEQLTLAGQFVFPPAAAAASRDQFGGLSGLASLRDGRELLAVADDGKEPRVFRLSVTDGPGGLRVAISGVIYLEKAPNGRAPVDPEGIAVTRNGNLLISSEGGGNEVPRLPPTIIEYSADGRFIRQLQVRPHHIPNVRGPVVYGVRQNAAFEALAVTPDYSRLFTATELPLVQDGEVDTFSRQNRSRLLEYLWTGSTYEPRREFAYDIEPMPRPPYETRFAINGVVELLSLGGDSLLVLERGFVESVDRSQSMNRIRIYRIDLAGATDVSTRDSLRGANDIVPVKKMLVLDVNALPGLAPTLTKLDNFEGMTWGPRAAGRRSLILVSDDNFSERQVTAFLLIRVPRSVGR